MFKYLGTFVIVNKIPPVKLNLHQTALKVSRVFSAELFVEFIFYSEIGFYSGFTFRCSIGKLRLYSFDYTALATGSR